MSDLLRVWEFDGLIDSGEPNFPGVVLASGSKTVIESIWNKAENCKIQ